MSVAKDRIFEELDQLETEELAQLDEHHQILRKLEIIEHKLDTIFAFILSKGSRE